MGKERESGTEKDHRYGARIPARLWKKIVDDKWSKRKSINAIIVEILEDYYN